MANDAKYVILTTDNFEREVLHAQEPVLVDFWAAWCGPCRMIAPAVEQVAAQFHGAAKVGKLNVDEHPEIAARFGIRSIPTLLFFRDGQVVDQVIGAVPGSILAEKLGVLVPQA